MLNDIDFEELHHHLVDIVGTEKINIVEMVLDISLALFKLCNTKVCPEDALDVLIDIGIIETSYDGDTLYSVKKLTNNDS